MQNAAFHFQKFKYLILFSFLFPTFDSFDGLFGFSAGAVFFRIILISFLLYYFFKFYFKIKVENYFHHNTVKLVFLFFLVFSFLVSFSLMAGINNLVLRDIFELHRPLYYSLIVITGMIISHDSELLKKNILSLFMFIIIVETILAVMHPLRIPFFQNLFMFYTKTPNALGYRSTGTFGNPYDFGVVMVFLIVLASQIFLDKKKIYYLAILLFSLFAMLLSQSKTALFIFIFCFLYGVSLSVILNRNVKIFLQLVISACVLILTAIFFYEDIYLLWVDNFIYMDRAFDIERVIRKSFQTGNRLYDLLWVLERYQNANLLNWFFGLGIGKGIYDDIEFGYAIYLYRYGIVGLFMYISILISVYIISLKSLIISRTLKLNHYKNLFYSFHIWSFGLIIGTLANNFIDQPRITFLYFSLFGLSLGFMISIAKSKPLNY